MRRITGQFPKASVSCTCFQSPRYREKQVSDTSDIAYDVSVDLPVVGDSELDDSGVSLIFQAQAGLAYDFTENTSAFIGYRLQGIPGQSFTSADVDLKADTTLIHSAQLGAQYGFRF